jgi:hypothetical protein
MRSLLLIRPPQLMRSLLLGNRLRLALKPRPVRRLRRVLRLQHMRKVHLVPQKKRPRRKNALGSSKIGCHVFASRFEV